FREGCSLPFAVRIAIFTDHGDRFSRCTHAEAANLAEHLIRREGLPPTYRLLDDRQQFTLQRSAMPLRPFPQTPHEFVGHVFYREVDRHVWPQGSAAIRSAIKYQPTNYKLSQQARLLTHRWYYRPARECI